MIVEHKNDTSLWQCALINTISARLNIFIASLPPLSFPPSSISPYKVHVSSFLGWWKFTQPWILHNTWTDDFKIQTKNVLFLGFALPFVERDLQYVYDLLPLSKLHWQSKAVVTGAEFKQTWKRSKLGFQFLKSSRLQRYFSIYSEN